MKLEAIRCESCNYEVLDSSRASPTPNLRSLYSRVLEILNYICFMAMQIMQ